MRLVVGDGKEKILSLMLLHIPDCLVRNPVGIGHFSTPILIEGCLRLAGTKPFFRRELFQVVVHVVPICTIPTIRTPPQSEVVPAVKVPLPCISGLDAVVREPLAQCLHIGPQRKIVGNHPVGVGEGPGKQSRACGTTYRLTAVSLLVTQTLSGKLVEVGSLHTAVAIAAQHVLAGGIGHNEHNLSWH
ncbi:hypothetical protein DSECCO2_617640 [anaerobic digester metagenome]